MSNEVKKMGLISLILMIFTSVFGFANGPVGFYLMGYSAIPWYILAAIFFFIPFALMMAEYGSAYRHEQGGIYSWMNDSVGPRYAFIVTFMWFTSYVIWMVSTSSKVWIPFSTFIFGTDRTQEWSLFGLSSTQTIGILGILWMVIVTLVAAKGLKQITKVTTVGGIAVMGLNVVLILTSLIILILNGGQFAQEINGVDAFITSPNPAYLSPLAVFSFVVFAIFAYGGTEAVAGLVDQTENPKKTFPKGILIAAVVISVGYALAILLWGVSANWQDVLSGDTTNMGNITYVLMYNLGLEFGHAIGVSAAVATEIAIWFARITGLSMFLAYTGAFFTLIYSPLKALIQGTPKEIWPKKLTKINKAGMPETAMWIQCLLVCLIVFLVSFGGSTASAFYNKLTLMANVSMTLPYVFLGLAFPFFKNREGLERPFVAFKSKGFAYLVTFVVVAVVGFANVFTIIQPAIEGAMSDTIWMVAGPVFFAILAFGIYENYAMRQKKNKL
ncbi:glutamate/gamma-aminobutyrate family transporter YjeM [Listeria costaricensis]|uniref:glutamate/gamma-aminobutyrate family transporter YjeM n=1 Tax=Listeria costaricensis TaxID=2026604 RepID=UPI000C081013|nr:glutamate/gamma-aminobutyrate family transporter YjeM [Listeria costaricensis]